VAAAVSKPATLREDIGFHAFTVTQLLGVFNDNAFKMMIFMLAVDASAEGGGGDLQAIASGLFALPFLLFSGFAGVLSDKFSKTRIIVWMKIAEIAIMVAGGVAFHQRSMTLLLATLFLMGAQSAFFGPAKYGILPEMLRDQNLARANGVILMTTFLAIILGSAAAGVVLDMAGNATHVPGLIYTGIAALGTVTALGVRRVPSAKPTLRVTSNPLGDLVPTLKSIARDGPLRSTIMAYSYFWFLGGVVQQAMNAYGRTLMDLSYTETGLLQVTLSAGMAAGFMVAGLLSRGRIHFGLTNWGIVGVTVCLGGLVFAHRALWLAHGTIFMLGVSGGFFALTLQTFVQHRAGDEEKGRVIAGMNFVNFVFIFLAAAYYGVAMAVFPNVAWVPGSLAVLTGVYALFLIPRISKTARSLGWEIDLLYHWLAALTRLSLAVYFRRVEIEGAEVPDDKPIVFVANHPSSMMDVLLLGTTCSRKIHFLAKSVLFRSRAMAAFLRVFGVIPAYRRMDGSDTGRNLESFERCFDVLARNGVIAVFPEGTSVTEPRLREFKTGAARIALGAEARHEFGLDVHVVPVALGYDAKSVFRSRVLISIGEPIRAADWKVRHEDDPHAAATELTAELQRWFDRVIPQADDWHELRFVRRVRRLYQDELRRRKLAEPGLIGPELGVKLDLTRRFQEGYRHYREADPSTVDSLRRRVDRLYEMLELVGLPPSALALEPRGVLRSTGFVAGNLAALVLGLPVYLVGLVHNYLPYKGVAVVARVLDPPPEATSGVKLCAGLVLFPLAHLGAAAAYGLLIAPIAAPISLLVTTTSGLFVLSYWHRAARMGKAAVTYLRNRGRVRAVLERHRQGILDDIERLVREYSPSGELA